MLDASIQTRGSTPASKRTLHLLLEACLLLDGIFVVWRLWFLAS